MGVLFNDVVINKLSGGLGRRTPDQDMISGLLFDGPDTMVKDKDGNNTSETLLSDGQLYRLASLEDAIGLGITSSYDRAGVSAYYQISQFFRMNPSGDLFIMKASESTYPKLVEKAEEMLLKADGEIRQLGIVFSTGAFATTKSAIEKAKTITESAFENHRPVEIILEGKGFDASDNAPYDLKESNAQNVSVMVAMDKEKAGQIRYFDTTTAELYELKEGDSVDADGKVTNSTDPSIVIATVEADTVSYSKTAAVGVLLGAVSKAKVSENIAWIEKFNLTGEGFRSIGFVGGTELKTEGTQKTIDANKYIFVRKHTGIAGIYFNDSHTCTESTSDFTFIEANRTIHKAARIARTALLPKVNAPVLVDPDTGTLPPSTVKGYETLCRAALERMISNEEVSEIDVYVNPNQNILADSILQVKIAIVPMGTARRIEVNLGFKNPFGLKA